MNYTPAFKAIIVLISSPLALLVALWGMTPKSTLQLMESSQLESTMQLRSIKPSNLEAAQMPQSVPFE
jgi:hypothetical protein